MKQMIVLASTIVLGVFIYTLIAGDGEGSIVTAMSSMWQEGLMQRSVYGQ